MLKCIYALIKERLIAGYNNKAIINICIKLQYLSSLKAIETDSIESPESSRNIIGCFFPGSLYHLYINGEIVVHRLTKN